MQKAVGLDGSELIVLAAEEFLALQAQVATLREMIRILEQRFASSQAIPELVLAAVESGTMPIVAWRKYREMSQAALALAAGISPPALHYIEHSVHYGRPKTRQAIATALGAPLWALDLPFRP